MNRLLMSILLIAIILTMWRPDLASGHQIRKSDCTAMVADRMDDMPASGRSPGVRKRMFRACKRKAIAHNRRHGCRRGHRKVIRSGVTVKHYPADVRQRRNLTKSLRVARSMRVPKSRMVALVAGIIQESTAYNKPSGSGDSVGILQLTSVHGNVQWRMKIENSVGWFLRGLHKLDPHGTAPLATTGYRVGLVQRQQRSSHPYAYNDWIPEARTVVRVFLGPCHA